jgi:hypothetical protein
MLCSVRTALSAAHRFRLALGLLGAFACVACATKGKGGGRVVEGDGSSSRSGRDVAAFTEVDVAMDIDAVIEIGPASSVDLSGDRNLLEHIETTVSGGRLTVSSRTVLRPFAPLRLIVRAPKLTAIRASGAAQVHVSVFVTDALSVSLSGSSQMTLKGGADRLSAVLGDTSRLLGRDLHALSAEVRGSGACHSEVWARDAVSGLVTGTCRLRIFSQPRDLGVSTGDTAVVESVDKGP